MIIESQSTISVEVVCQDCGNTLEARVQYGPVIRIVVEPCECTKEKEDLC